MNEFEGTFEFFCKPTKTADNKKTIVELTAGYDCDRFCEVEKFWDQKIILYLMKEELKEKLKKELKEELKEELEESEKFKKKFKEKFKKSENSKVYNFIVIDDKHNKGAKDVKTFTIFLSKLFDMDDHLELDEFLHQKVFVTWNQLQPDLDFNKSEDPDIDFEKSEDENEIDDLRDPGNSDDDE